MLRMFKNPVCDHDHVTVRNRQAFRCVSGLTGYNRCRQMIADFRGAIVALTLASGGAIVGASGAQASPDISRLADPVQVGEARLSFLGFVIYEGRLFTEGGQAFSEGAPVALEILYRRDFSAQQMLTTTRSELGRVDRDATDNDQIVNQLSACFRDVADGDRYLAISPLPDELELKLNGTTVCDLRAPGIGQRFLAIWLSDESRFPRLSRRLRGL